MLKREYCGFVKMESSRWCGEEVVKLYSRTRVQIVALLVSMPVLIPVFWLMTCCAGLLYFTGVAA